MRAPPPALGEREREDEVPSARIVLRPEPAAVRLGEPACDGEAEAGAVSGRAAAERLEQRLPLLVGQAGSRVDDVDAQLGGAALRPQQHVRAGRGVAERVLEQVGEHPLDLGGVDLHRRRLGPDVEPDATRIGSEARERLADELVDVPQLAVRLGRACLEPREVEQLLDDAVEACRLVADRLGESEPVLRLERRARGSRGRRPRRGSR